MREANVHRDNIGMFHYNCGDLVFNRKSNNKECYYCTMPLDHVYSVIIDRLKEEGIVDKDHKEICCLCYALENDMKSMFESVSIFIESIYFMGNSTDWSFICLRKLYKNNKKLFRKLLCFLGEKSIEFLNSFSRYMKVNVGQ